jgi:hypothetical protein
MFLAFNLFSMFRSIKVKIVFVKMSVVQISLISKVLQIRGCVTVADIQIVVFLLQLQILINHGINIIICWYTFIGCILLTKTLSYQGHGISRIFILEWKGLNKARFAQNITKNERFW